jgi:hypothetical protein
VFYQPGETSSNFEARRPVEQFEAVNARRRKIIRTYEGWLRAGRSFQPARAFRFVRLTAGLARESRSSAVRRPVAMFAAGLAVDASAGFAAIR